MKSIKYLFLLSIFAMSSTTASAASNDDRLIENILSAWSDKVSQGKTSAISDYYTLDAIMLPPSSEILANPVSIRAYWKQIRSAGFNDYTVYPVELKVEGETAYQSAIWEAVRTTAEGEVIYLEGNISSIFERQKDGSWKIKVQSWN